MEPASLLAVWSAGLGAGSALVARWRVVGPGYIWLSLGVAGGLGLTAFWAGAGSFALVGVAFAIVGIVMARSWFLVVVAGVLGAFSFALAAADGSQAGQPLLVLTGAAFLGGVTCEMMLGHWYLVDPTLPRSCLHALDQIAMVALVADALALVALGVFPWPEADFFSALGWMLLAATTLLLLVAVRFSLREPGYAGVMAATGLSYLGVLTAVGAVFLGRVVLTAG